VRSGLFTAAGAQDSDGGLARYRLLVEPWLGLLAHGSSSHVWQDKSISAIVDTSHSHQASYAWPSVAQAERSATLAQQAQKPATKPG
jgi:uncharacterized protein involved in type VI secretion and phage assembly